MSDAIGKKHTYASLLIFLLPTIAMQIILSLYTIVDGMFVSRFVSTTAVSAINICLPIIYVYTGIGSMLGVGGSSVVSILLGEGKREEANRVFGLVIVLALFFGALVAIICNLFLSPLHILIGASESVLPYCNEYGGILYTVCTGYIMKCLLDYFIVVAGKPKLGVVSSIMGAIVNIVMDYVLIVELDMGIAGAAIGTFLGNVAPCLFSLWILSKPGLSIQLKKPLFSWPMIWGVLRNGFSQFVTYVAIGITTYLFNVLSMKYAGDMGVAAMTIVMYIQFITISLHTGFSGGIMPLISFQFGAENLEGLQRIFKQAIVLLVTICSVAFVIIQVLNPVFVNVFVNRGEVLYDMSLRGMNIANFGFCFAGINVFASSLFSGLNNGKMSTFISTMRNFVFVLLGMMILPTLFELDGVWLVFDFAEVLSIVVGVPCILYYNSKYHYIK